MRNSRYRILFGLLTIAYGHVAAAQIIAPGNNAHPGVILVKLSPPLYPEIARTAQISGDIQLKLGIRKDGSVESVVVTSGPPMLRQAALDSAQQSQFECRECSDEVTPYRLTYSFQLGTGTGGSSSNEKPGVKFIQSRNLVIITAEPVRVIVDFASFHVRSARCLYLWRCGIQWGGEDYYYYRVRSAKCAYLWRCGLHPRLPSP